MSTCTEHRMLNMLHHSSIFYQLAQARPHNVLHFLVIGASLSEPHTSVTALQDASVCLSARTFVWPYTENFN